MTPEDVLHREARRAHRNPSDPQKAANNYRHGHVRMHGLHFAIENARGSYRRGTDAGGKPWSVKMEHAYGYIKGHTGADGDQVDAYFGPHLKSPRVYVVDQHDHRSGQFDEHKVFLGFVSKKQVEEAYCRAFSDGRGRDRLGPIATMSVDEFKGWLRNNAKPAKRAKGGRVPHYADGGALPDGFTLDEPASSPGLPDGFTLDPAPPEPSTMETLRGLGKQATLGVGRGLADIGGALYDAVTGKALSDIAAGNAAADAVPADQKRAAFEKASQTPGTGQFIRETVGLEGDNAPKTALERIASGVGQGAAGAVLTPGAVLENIAVQGFAGGFGKTAAELAPDKYKPAADIAGNIIGGGAAALGPGLARGAVDAGARYVAPLTTEGRKTLAGKVLDARAENPDAVRAATANGADEIIPGSQPTTFQQTGDMGLGALEREAATKDPAAFNQRRAEQNSARLDVLGDTQAAGDPAEVSAALRNQLADIDAMTQRHVDTSLADTQTSAGALGGNGTPEGYGETIRGAVQPRVDALTGQARTAVEGMGGQATPEAYGQTFRQALAEANQAARAHESRLWDAVDPGNHLTVGMAPIQEGANAVYGGLTQAAEASLTPGERQILGVIDQYQGVEPFRELTDLRSLVSTEMRAMRGPQGNDQALRRLTMLRSEIEGTINSEVQGQLAREAEAVRAGQIDPEETIAARLQRESEQWLAARRDAQARATADAQERTAPFSSVSRNEVPPGHADALGDPGVSEAQPLAINFDDEAHARLRAASQATAERHQTFDPYKPMLRRPSADAPYQMAEAAVPAKVFTPGPTGAQTVQRFLQAAPSPATRQAVQDYAVASMRGAAVRDGLVDPVRFAAWRQRFGDALRAFPELDARLQNIARASALARDLAPFGNRSNATLPSQYFHAGERGFEDVGRLRAQMGTEAANKVLDDYAAHSLRNAAMTPDGAIDPAKFARWKTQHADALRAMPDTAAKFADAASAAKSLEDAIALRRSALDEAQAGAIGKIMGLSDSQDIGRSVMSMFGRNTAMQDIGKLVAQLRGRPEAVEGLRKAVADQMWQKLRSNTEAATSRRSIIKADQFQTFVKANKRALEMIFTPEQVKNFEAIAADMERSNRSLNAVKIPGQSNTAQDLTAVAANSTGGSVLAHILKTVAGAAGAAIATGSHTLGAAAGLLGHFTGVSRAAGFAKVDDLVKEALLNPNVAHELLMRVPANPKSVETIGKLAARRVLATLAQTSANADERKSQ